MSGTVTVVGIGGSTGSGSTTERAVRIALGAAAERGARTQLIGGPELMLPLYDAVGAGRCARARRLVASVAAADGLIIGTPAYHGSVSGMVKNALDYVEDLRTDERPYFSGRAVGCVVVARGCQGAGSALAALRTTVHALRGWPTPLGVTVNTEPSPFDPGERLDDPRIRERLELLGNQVAEFALMHRVGTGESLRGEGPGRMGGPHPRGVVWWGEEGERGGVGKKGV
ncbi:NAD(P)H-dependent oxidoreductase, partial [Streptomyces sp. NPDC050704]|uniref:NADPH-dependent FMN reductase n=1 Tax=Streptomyces sp. NPDC050704 TaxID=3157219 RepID=UPI003436B2D2